MSVARCMSRQIFRTSKRLPFAFPPATAHVRQPFARNALKLQATGRWQSTLASTPKAASTEPERTKHFRPAPHRNPNEPIYQLTFTCKVCNHRSAHTVSQQGYHKGTVLITCDGCQNRHLISDNLGIFRDKAITLEQIMADQGEGVKRGTVDMEGDVEFWAEPDVSGNAAKEEQGRT